jgi:cyclase
MFRPRIIPVLTLKGKGLVKTVKFNQSNARYIGDPINAVRIFNDLEADELVFLDITATNEKRTIDVNLVKNIGDEAYMPFAVGGGISKLSQIEHLIKAGAEKIVLCSYAMTLPSLIKEAADHFGNQSIIVCLNIKRNVFGNYQLYTKGKDKKVSTPFIDYIRQAVEMGAGEILINNIDTDGCMRGYDLNLIRMTSSMVDVPVIACGGAGNEEDLLLAVNQGGATAAAAGSLFVYHGPRNAVLINYPDKNTLSKIFNIQ